MAGTKKTDMPRADALREHLVTWHSATLQPASLYKTEADLDEFHAWDHETGEIGPSHDVTEIIVKPESASRKRAREKAGW